MEKLSILYAQALFNLALEKNAADEFLEQAIVVRDTLRQDDVKQVLFHPHIADSEKKDLFNNAFAGKVNSDILGFLFLVTDKNREQYLLPALDRLIENINRHNSKITAKVQSAAPFDNKQTQALTAMLSKKLDKHVEIELSVDPSLIGGPFIYADGYYMDWTVKTRLRELKRSLKEQVN